MTKSYHFQVKIQGVWKDYSPEEDKLLKCGYMSGVPILKLRHHGHCYEYDFGKCHQRNLQSGRTREIRPPRGWKPPSQPVVPASTMTTLKLTADQPGKVICLRHPLGGCYTIKVPPLAREGQTMLVPVPENPSDSDALACGRCGKTIGSKVAMGLSGAAAAAPVAGFAIAGAVAASHGDSVDEHVETLESGFDVAMSWTFEAGDLMADFFIDLF